MTADGQSATTEDLTIALRRVLRAENAHFARIWERAPKAQRIAELFLAEWIVTSDF